MALTPEEEAELAELEKQVSPELRALAQPKGAAIDQPATPGSDEGLGGIKAVYGKDWTPYGAGGQPISQTQTDKQRDDAALQAEAERVAGMLDPRFSIVPQVLALQPATNDLQGDEAAKAKFEAGQRDPIVIYEPPVDRVREQLLQNPALLRAVSPDEVPTTAEIANLTADSALYQTTADWMYQQADKVATEKGQKIVRFSKAPWLTLDPAAMKLKVGGAASEGANQAQAFVLGVDDMATAGAGRALQEFAEPTTMVSQDSRLGVNSSVPQSSAEVNAWTEEEYPLSYGAGQVVGMLNPRGVFNRLFGNLDKVAGWAGNAAARTRLGGALGDVVPGAVKSAAGAVGNAATGGVAAGAGQVVQEGVDAAGRGEMPDLREAAGRVQDVAENGAILGGAGSVLRRLSGGGADIIRESPRFTGIRGPGAVGRTESNLEYRLGFEPRLSQETKTLVKESAKGGYLPSDVLAEEIAGPVGKAAEQNARVSADRAGAVKAAYQRSAEGGELVPVQQVQEEALEKVRSHYQPEPGGRQRALNDRPPPAQKVFNTLVDEVSTSPVKGASKLNPDEAENFLGTRARYKILQRDIEASREASKAPREPIQRDEFLQTIDSRKRAAVEEEIDAAIDDVVGDVTPTPARRAKVEQEVLREFVDEASFREANGSLGDYLRQRGIDAVYVTPRKLDARRTDTLIDLLKDDDLAKAAKRDRGQFRAGGKEGGYNEMLEQQGAEAARHKQIAEEVAPGGNAFQPIAGLYQPQQGEKQLLDKVTGLAEQSGVSNQLDRFRHLQETLAVQNRASWRGDQGQTNLRPTNFADAAYLRGAFPALKALEGPLGPLRGSTAGRPALMGGGETNAAQSRAESGARGRYEADRDRRLKEIADAKAREDQERSRRQNETIQRRR
jgi:hypothetical protein